MPYPRATASSHNIPHSEFRIPHFPMPPASSIRVYSTLTRTKEPFEPVHPGKVGMYLCGPTVYKPSHIGHMVGPVIFDAIKRFLAYSGYKVTWVVNITDVDDKLIAESGTRGISMSDLADEMTADYMRNLAAIGVDTIDHFPKATDSIDEIIRLTQTLIDQGFAYASDGDVYFDVGKDAQYGKLSRRSLDSMQGEGGEMAVRKRSPADFALWKSAKPGEPSWDSPWGKGRPGWHIECSAMSRRLLGETFDIHGGGLDLIFPHHENEIAQSECAHGKPQAKYWLHNGLMQAAHEVGKVGGRATRTTADSPSDSPSAPGSAGGQSAQAAKISKSTGASPFSELLARHSPEVIRFFLLSTHYRSPIQYSEELLEETARSMEAFYRLFKRYERIEGASFYDVSAPRNRAEGEFDPGSDATLREVSATRQRFLEAMDDDFNTGVGVAALFDLVRALNKYADAEKLEQGKPDAAKVQVFKQAARTFRELSATLGLFLKPVVEKSTGGDDGLVGQLMQLLIDVRAGARQNKDFATADTIRKRLGEIGIALEDRPGGTDWTRS
jgi:cysteinyl-tRNA synthetase